MVETRNASFTVFIDLLTYLLSYRNEEALSSLWKLRSFRSFMRRFTATRTAGLQETAHST